MNRQPWKCSGTLKKYGTPCPQTLGFLDANKLSLDQVKAALQIKCQRCSSLEGNPEMTLDAA